MSLRDIRLYGRTYPPESFTKSGWRGVWIRVLNRVRLSLELRCQFHAMMLLGQRAGLDADHVGQEVRNYQSKVVRYIKESTELRNLATATPDQLLKPETIAGAETRKTLARLTAQGRSRRYRRGRFTFPIYEGEAYPYGQEGQSERAATADGDARSEESQDFGAERQPSERVSTEKESPAGPS